MLWTLTLVWYLKGLRSFVFSFQLLDAELVSVKSIHSGLAKLKCTFVSRAMLSRLM